MYKTFSFFNKNDFSACLIAYCVSCINWTCILQSKGLFLCFHSPQLSFCPAWASMRSPSQCVWGRMGKRYRKRRPLTGMAVTGVARKRRAFQSHNCTITSPCRALTFCSTSRCREDCFRDSSVWNTGRGAAWLGVTHTCPTATIWVTYSTSLTLVLWLLATVMAW